VWRELEQKGPEAQALRRIGSTQRDAGRLDEAEAAYLRSIAIFEGLGERREAAIVQAQLALTWVRTGRLDEASRLVEVAVAELAVDDPDSPAEPDSAGAWALEMLGATRLATGSAESAYDCHARSLGSFRSRNERYGSACALLNLGRCAAALGRTGIARDHLAESLRLFTGMGNVDGQADAEEALAALPGEAEPVRRPLSSLFGGSWRAAK
jgi:tetratricopeptide (TPR) repeat protein